MTSATPRPGVLGRVAPNAWMPIGIDELEPAALAALRDPGSTLVLAGPGAGKTEYLAQRAAYLLQTGLCANPRRILAISYKRDAAANLARRVAGHLPESADRFVSITFDAFTKGLVDRFRAALPPAWTLWGEYELSFWTSREQGDFVVDLANRSSDQLRADLHSLETGKFLSSMVGAWPLPLDPTDPPAAVRDFAIWSWWQTYYLSGTPQHVDFVMLNRLAELIVRCRPQIARALRATYPFVFVDEFQDTAPGQLSILHSLFGTGTVVTAVGDVKQRIMVWAGAHQSAIEEFTSDFAATRYDLTWNFRSSDPLVEFQHIVASRVDPTSVRGVSKARTEDDHIPICLWTYSSQEAEAQHLADWIAQDIRSSGRQASDFVFVARQKVADYETALAAALAVHRIALRNDDVRYGTMTLQDLLKHDVTRLLLRVLHLAVQPRGLGATWIEVIRVLSRIYGAVDDEQERRLSDRVARFVKDLGSWLNVSQTATTEASDLVAGVVGVADEALLRSYIAATHRGDDLDVVLESLTARVAHVLPTSSTWGELIENVEATDAVTLSTIHRSKGLEYHTVMFLGLDDDQWWSHQRSRSESTSTFFVGLSRAAQRLVFTSARPVARRAGISDLYDALRAAGTPEQYWG
jgi:superfamily I DNA/RNA helicase